MSLEALSSNELSNFIIYDTISATPYGIHDTVGYSFASENIASAPVQAAVLNYCSLGSQQRRSTKAEEAVDRRQNLAVQGRKKRRRQPRVCKSKEEAETQRMTHIAVERNRRKQMNEHLSVLRSLMPESYVQRGDQASIVGGAIEFVKELEHLLQSLEARKLQLLQQVRVAASAAAGNEDTAAYKFLPPQMAQFFLYPKYTWSQVPNKYTSKTTGAIADIEATLVETHANIRILSQRSPRQLSKLVAGFQSLQLSVLHLNVITMDPLVLYCISAKVEEGCQLISVDAIVGAVHHMLIIIDEESAIC